MSSLDDIAIALRKADAAGNTDDARRLAQAYRQMQSQQTAQPDQVLPDTNVTAQPEESTLHALGRNALMQAREFGKGVASLGGIVIDPVTRTINYAAQKTGLDPTGKYAIPTVAGSVDYALNTAGVPNPQPQNNSEAMASRIAGGLGGVAGGAGVGSLIKQAPGVVGDIGNVLTQNIGAQTASGATGAAASELARQHGAGTVGQIAAGLAGGLAPMAATAGVPAAVRGALRGGEDGRQTVASNIAAFNEAGTAPSVGQATQRPALQGIEQTLSRTPGAAGVMINRAKTQAQNISQGLEDVASTLSPTASPGKAGISVQRGITAPGGFVDKTKQVANQLYDKLDQYIPKGKRVDVSNTQNALAALNADIPGAPAVSKFFKNGRIMGIQSGLAEDTGGTAAVLTRPGMQQKADALRQQLTDQSNSQRAALEAQNQAAQAENARLQSLGLEPKMKVLTPDEINAQVASPKDIDNQVNQYLGSQVDNKLPYEALKKLRTLVGQEMDNSSLVTDVPRSKWKAVYGALSEDLKNAADTPEAQQAWNRANQYYNARMQRMDLLDSAIDKQGGPEKVFNALWSGAKDGNTTLRAVMQSIPSESQKDLAAAFVRRLGRAVPSAQNAEGDVFSTQTFLTNWNRISPEAKATLFNRFGKKFSDSMDKIASVASNLREGSQTFANPSGTAAAGAQIAGLTSFVTSLATGNVGVAGAIAGGAATANLWARAMTNPRFVNWLAQQTKVPIGAIPQQVAILKQEADKANDQDTKDAADAILKAYNQQQAKAKNK